MEEKKPRKFGVTSARAEQIEQLIEFMGEDMKEFPKWCGMTKHLSPGKIHDMMKKANGGYNKRGLFMFLLKKSKI